MRAPRSIMLAVALALGALGCRDATADTGSTMVFAAASLTESFEVLARAFEERHPGTDVELHFAGTPQLVLQLREGAPADVLASADEANMQRVVDTGRTASEPRVFARNHLAIVTRAGNPRQVRALEDLAREDLRVVLCGPQVPAGGYAREALAKAGVAARSLSDEPSVKAVVSKVALGEVDAGVVYVTDAAGIAGVEAIPVAREHDVVATYPIAVLGDGPGRARAEAFVAFVLSPEGQEILRGFGFVGP